MKTLASKLMPVLLAKCRVRYYTTPGHRALATVRVSQLKGRWVRTAHKLSPAGPKLSSAGRNNILPKGSGPTEDNFPPVPKITSRWRVEPCPLAWRPRCGRRCRPWIALGHSIRCSPGDYLPEPGDRPRASILRLVYQNIKTSQSGKKVNAQC